MIGRSFELDLLARVLDDDEERLARPLAELAEHFFLAPSASSGRYSFRHGLMCDAIYERIPEPERRRLHARIADVAAAGGDFSDAFLSRQFERAGRSAEAFDAALRAARAAMTISAWREADELYRRAVRNAPDDLPVSARAPLMGEHGEAAAAADDNETAAAAYDRAVELWRRAGDRTAAAVAIPPLVAARHLLGDDLEARVGRLEAGLATLVDEPVSVAALAARARLEAGLSSAFMLDRRLDQSIEHGRTAMTLAREAGDALPERNASVTVGACLVFAGRMDEGWSLLEGGIERTRAEHLEAEAARAYRMIGSCASVLVEYERGERFLREGIDFAERVELWNHRHYMAAHLGHVLWATGRWSEALTVAEHALADGRGGITTRITALHVLGYVALGRGDWAAAEAALEEAREAGERMRELQRLSPALWGLAELALLRGDASAAVDWTERGRVASAAVDDAAYLFPFLVTGTRAWLALADPAAAERWVDAVEPALRHRSIPGTLPAIGHARGLVELASGHLAAARGTLAAAADAWAGRGRTWEGTWARLDLARALARANRPAEAARLLGQVESVAADLGSAPLAARAADVLRDSRHRQLPGEPWDPLTAREFEVARLVADGSTNAEIAERLGLSPRTAGSHVEHILAKLGASRRAEIGAWVAAIGREAAAR